MIECATLEKTIEAVRQIPPQDRRIIVSTGIHPHEGTTELARPYEGEWRKYGALIVAHPGSLTPHAVWRRQKKISCGVFTPLDPGIDIREEIVESAITREKHTVFIRFHGLEGDDRRRLAIIRSADPFGWFYPMLPRSLQDGFPKELEFADFPLPPHRLMVEYRYLGRRRVKVAPFIAQAIKEQDHFYNPREESEEPDMPRIFSPDDPNWVEKGDLYPAYLTQPRPTKADIQAFHQDYSSTLTKLIKHISQFLPTS